ncbi:MAG: DsrE family protein [Saprospiraceae bacterium]|nr:DsrE family protein [Saprospiraceae bacterium]
MMRYLLATSLLIILFDLHAQQEDFVNPIIKQFGGIYPLHDATVKPDPNLRYQIVIDIVSGQEDPKKINPALNNVARLMNLHSLGGVPSDSLDIVLAVHGGATVTLLNEEAYADIYGCPNPNLKLIDALEATGVLITVCGQSLIHEKIVPDQVYSKVGIATSMLTTVTMYMQRGYHLLKF